MIGSQLTAAQRKARHRRRPHRRQLPAVQRRAALVDIALGVPAGGGGLDLNLGGATVNINDDPPHNAFGSFGLVGNSSPSDTGGSSPVFTPGDAGTPFIPGTSGTPGTSGSSAPASSGPSGAQSLGPTTKTAACASLSEAGGSCSGGGAAVWIGLGALALLLAAFAWDFVRQRRRRLMSIGENL